MREIITIMTGQCGSQIGSKMSEYQHYQDAPADKERVVVYTPKKWKQTRLNSSVADSTASTFQQFTDMRLQFAEFNNSFVHFYFHNFNSNWQSSRRCVGETVATDENIFDASSFSTFLSSHHLPIVHPLPGGTFQSSLPARMTMSTQQPFSSVSPNIMIHQQQQQPNLLSRQITLEEAKENAGSCHDDEHSTLGVQMAMSGASMPNRGSFRGGRGGFTSVGNAGGARDSSKVDAEGGNGRFEKRTLRRSAGSDSNGRRLDYDISPVRGGGSEDTSVEGNRDNNKLILIFF
uniref:Uncharacterized protein n=2 Tax=Meloidogyne TaxID=189290 RepID=A0A914N3J6_MELIC